MKSIFIWSAFFGLTGIAFGALGAHALKEVLEPRQIQSFETGVRYQMYHALFLILIGILQHIKLISNTNWITRTAVFGVFFFSFSIYLLNLQDVLGLNLGFLGPITPVGGLLLMSSWALLLVGIMRTWQPSE